MGKSKKDYTNDNATIRTEWKNLLKDYIQPGSSNPNESEIPDAKNAAAEYAAIFGKKNRYTTLRDIPVDPMQGSANYPIELVKELEPNKWQLLLKYLNSNNYDAPNYRN
jgi:hypothetical protein